MVYNRNNSPERGLSPEGVYTCCTPHRDVIFVLLYRTTYKTQKGGKWQTPEILDKYSFVKKITKYNNRDVQLLHWRISVQQKPQNVQQEKMFSLTQKIVWKREQMSLLDVSLPFSNKICIRKRLNSIYWYHLLINLGAYLLTRHWTLFVCLYFYCLY